MYQQISYRSRCNRVETELGIEEVIQRIEQYSLQDKNCKSERRRNRPLNQDQKNQNSTWRIDKAVQEYKKCTCILV